MGLATTIAKKRWKRGFFDHFKDEKDKEAIARFKAEIKNLKNERKVVEKEIKDATTENSLCARAARPVIKAQKLFNLIVQIQHFGK